MNRNFWMSAGCRALDAMAPDDRHSPLLTTLANDLAKELIDRDDYPEIGVLFRDAVILGETDAAIKLIEHLFPGWGYNVGRPLTVRSPVGWYACVFRERRSDEGSDHLAGMWVQDGRRGGTGATRYAHHQALALIAALCYALADNEIGASAIEEPETV